MEDGEEEENRPVKEKSERQPRMPPLNHNSRSPVKRGRGALDKKLDEALVEFLKRPRPSEELAKQAKQVTTDFYHF